MFVWMHLAFYFRIVYCCQRRFQMQVRTNSIYTGVSGTSLNRSNDNNDVEKKRLLFSMLVYT